MPSLSKSLDRAIESLLTNEKLAQTRRRMFDRLPVSARGVVRRGLQREPLFERQPSLISVVLPVYNVEDYLAECLRSIVNQSYSRLQIIVVDDGSTDGSLQIAQAFARKDRRIKIVRQKNAGLGAARNTGMQHADGEFLVFADSDDVIPPNAYREMYRTLQVSGSDFVVGAYFRMSETSEYLPPWLGELHEEERLAINASEFTGGLANVFAWNKMFRQSFVDRISLTFPEGIRYEDQFPITRAYLLADSFDVIPEIVYKWRIRFDGSSITQNKRSLEDVSDRVAVVKSLYEYLRYNAEPDFFDAWVAKVLGMDLIPYVSESLHADDDYRRRVRELIHLMSDHVTPGIQERIDVRTRVALYVLDRGSVEDLGHVMLTHNEIGHHLPTVVEDDGRVLFTPTYPKAMRLEIPTGLRVLGEEELRTDHAVTRTTWRGQQLTFHGWGFIRHIDADESSLPTSRMYLRSIESGQQLDFVLSEERQFVSRWYHSKWPNYDNAGFAASLPVNDLAGFLKANGDSEVRLEVSENGRVRDIQVTNVIGNGSAGAYESFVTSNGELIALSKPRGEGLTISLTSVPAVLDTATIAGERCELRVRTRDSAGGWKSHTVRLSASSRRLPRAGGVSLQRELYAPHDVIPDGARFEGSLGLLRSRKAKLLWRAGNYSPLVTSHRIVGDELVVRGLGDPRRISSLSLESDLLELPAREISWTGNAFLASIPLRYDEFGHERTASFGGYRLVVKSGRKSFWLRPAQELHDALPLDSVGNLLRVRTTRTSSGSLWLELSHPSRDDETGSLGQAKLQRWHQQAQLSPIPESVFFQSYLGEQATDSALALHRELRSRFPTMKLFWGVADASVALPEGAIPVVRYTRDWYETISRAEYLVNNIYFFSWFKKRDFQTYIQTWHGTPLKKIGRSYWEDRRREPIWIERMDDQAASWDFLVSPNQFCTEKFAEEFRYTGKILETGYPRNDVLSSTDPERTAAIRARLDIASGQRVVLYAPTWRDNKSAQAWVAEFVQLLDLQALSAELGDGYTILVRGHGHNARAGSVVGSSGRVIDATFYPEINDLYEVSDLVITDYSSVMFDFAVTKKPLLFFAPDLSSYADGVRGFYFDYQGTVPGPVLAEQEEVAETVRELLDPAWSPDARYLAFVERFCSLEDGRAAERVVDAVWGTDKK